MKIILVYNGRLQTTQKKFVLNLHEFYKYKYELWMQNIR